MLRLALGTMPLFAAIVGFAVALGAYMTYSSIMVSYRNVIESRLTVVAEQLVSAIETAQSLGIPLSEQVTLPPVLAAQVRSDPILMSIDLHARDGRILFSSDPVRTGRAVDPVEPEGGVLVLRRDIINDLGVTAGVLLLRYDEAPIAHETQRIARATRATALPVAALAVVVGSVGVLVIFGLMRRRALRRGEALAAGTAEPIAATRARLEALERLLADGSADGPFAPAPAEPGR